MTEDQLDAQEEWERQNGEMLMDLAQMEEGPEMGPGEFDAWMEGLHAEHQARVDHENAIKGTESPFDLPAELA